MTDTVSPLRRGPQALGETGLPVDHHHHVRIVEAVLFAAADPLSPDALRGHLPDSADLGAILSDLEGHYRGRGVTLIQVAGGWAFRTASDLAEHLRGERPQPRKLSRAALETLAIIAYHQPVTRAELETIRGVSISKGTIDTLMEAGWIKPGKRRAVPGQPHTWITTPGFLDHFGLDTVQDLPGLDELKAMGLLDARPALQTLPGGRLDTDEEPDEGPSLEDYRPGPPND